MKEQDQAQTQGEFHFIPATHLVENSHPYSSLFNDVYFNDEGGLAETRYVFIQANRLKARWQRLKAYQTFQIGETGFGTGLNFLATLDAWQSNPAQKGHLHFISFEKYPLALSSLLKAHQHFPELKAQSAQLISLWRNFKNSFRQGLHRFELSDNVSLTLIFGDALNQIKQLNANIDAWFLDGFSPKKNPDLWQENLVIEINKRSTLQTTLTTFTASSQVNKTLKNNGFTVTKIPGFGKKREMITAQFSHPITAKVDSDNPHLWHPKPPASPHIKTVTLLGGGIAGLCLAYYFKRAGYHVTVIDHHDLPMQRASGNQLAMVMPVITAERSTESDFYLRAFEHALRFYQADEFFPIGVEQQLSGKKQKQWAKAVKKSNLPQHIIDFAHPESAFYPDAGYIDTKALGNRLRSFVDEWIVCEVKSITQTDKNLWQLFNSTQTQIHETPLLIIANGIGAQSIIASHEFNLTAKHGMTTCLKPKSIDKFEHIQLSKGYLIPNINKNQWLCGATFDHLDDEKWLRPAQLHDDHAQRNLELWQHSNIYDTLKQTQVTGGHAAIRATTPDHLPVCGPLIDQAQFKLDCPDLHHGRHWQQYPPAKTLNNAYTLNGLGSRGFTSAPILAQYLAAMILAEPLPLENDLCKIIHPNRFLYRSLKKPPKN